MFVQYVKLSFIQEEDLIFMKQLSWQAICSYLEETGPIETDVKGKLSMCVSVWRSGLYSSPTCNNELIIWGHWSYTTCLHKCEENQAFCLQRAVDSCLAPDGALLHFSVNLILNRGGQLFWLKGHLRSFGKLSQAKSVDHGSASSPPACNSSPKLPKWLCPILGWVDGMGPWMARE